MELYHGDCVEEMKKIAAGTVQLILTDLPYGTTRNKWDVQIPFEDLWPEWERILTETGTVLLFGAEPFASKQRMSNAKWYKYDWVWIKTRGSDFLNANRKPLSAFETISVFYKKRTYYPIKTKGTLRHGTAKYNGGTYGAAGKIEYNSDERFPLNILQYPKVRGKHPSAKPVDMLSYLIRTYTMQGETVLDCCMGGGNTGIAAMQEKRKFIGIEKDEKWYEISVDAIKKRGVEDDSIKT